MITQKLFPNGVAALGGIWVGIFAMLALALAIKGTMHLVIGSAWGISMGLMFWSLGLHEARCTSRLGGRLFIGALITLALSMVALILVNPA